MDVVGMGREGSGGNLDIVASGWDLRGLVPRPEIPLQPDFNGEALGWNATADYSTGCWVSSDQRDYDAWRILEKLDLGQRFLDGKTSTCKWMYDADSSACWVVHSSSKNGTLCRCAYLVEGKVSPTAINDHLSHRWRCISAMTQHDSVDDPPPSAPRHNTF